MFPGKKAPRDMPGSTANSPRKDLSLHDQNCRNQAVRRPEARHIRPAQEGAGLPAAQLCREFHPVDFRFHRGFRRQGTGDRRRRPLFQPRGDPDRHPHGGGKRLRLASSSGAAASFRRRPPRTSSANTRRSAASSFRQATIPAARTRISASSTTSAMAARRPKRSPTRSSRAPGRSPATGSPTFPRSTSTASASSTPAA